MTPERRERLEHRTIRPLAALTVFAGVVGLGMYLFVRVIDGVLS